MKDKRMKERVIMFSVVSILVGGQICSGAELGRREISTPPETEFSALAYAGRGGLEIDLSWDGARWKIKGPESLAENAPTKTENYSAGGWNIGAAAFYCLDEIWDIRAAIKLYNLENDDGETSLVRLGAGTRCRLNTGTNFEPYLSAIVGYYLSIDAEEDERSVGSIDGDFGLGLKAGVAYLLSDNLDLRLGLHYEGLLGVSDAEVNGRDGEYGFHSFGFGLGLTCYF